MLTVFRALGLDGWASGFGVLLNCFGFGVSAVCDTGTKEYFDWSMKHRWSEARRFASLSFLVSVDSAKPYSGCVD